MSSLTEMLQTATSLNDIKNQNSTSGVLSGIVNSALSGFESGRKLAAQDKVMALDRAVKMIDIQKKNAEMEREAMNTKISLNLAKRLGLVDLTPQEQDHARSVAFDGLGGGAPAPMDHTSSGKMSKIFSDSIDTPYNVPKPKWSPKEGLSIDFEKDPNARTTAPKDPSADQARIREQAISTARREKFATISSILPPEQAQKYSNIEPTEDEIQKYIPEITAFQQGDKAAAKKLLTDRKKAMAPTTDALKAMQGQLGEGTLNSIEDRAQNLASKATRGFVKPVESPLPGMDSDTLTQYRNQILNGASIQDILDQIGGKIKKLSADPTKNRNELVTLVKQKIGLMKFGGQ